MPRPDGRTPAVHRTAAWGTCTLSGRWFARLPARPIRANASSGPTWTGCDAKGSGTGQSAGGMPRVWSGSGTGRPPAHRCIPAALVTVRSFGDRESHGRDSHATAMSCGQSYHRPRPSHGIPHLVRGGRGSVRGAGGPVRGGRRHGAGRGWRRGHRHRGCQYPSAKTHPVMGQPPPDPASLRSPGVSTRSLFQQHDCFSNRAVPVQKRRAPLCA